MKNNYFVALFLIASLSLATLTADAFAKGQGDCWIDAKKAKAECPDFSVQGEYKNDKIAAQVVAMGGGKFRVVGLNALPGENETIRRVTVFDVETKDGKIGGDNKAIKVIEGEKMPDGFSVVIKDGVLTLTEPDGDVMKLKRVERQSPTLGAKPPKGAVVLFDGTSADKFEKGRLSEDKLLMEGCWSKDTFGDCKIHLEFLTPFKPAARGQGRGNSGLYVQGRYETQILDAFGNKPADNETGGVYKIAPPKVNACLPPLTWQTYDIDFKAAQFKDGKKVKNGTMTVLLNGVKIHEDLELTHATTASKLREGPEDGPLYLQNHGNPVRFKNIWVVPK